MSYLSLLVFFKKGFKFQPYVCNKCHDLSKISTNLSDIVILNIENADCRYIVTGISKSKALKLLQNFDLTEKIGKL